MSTSIKELRKSTGLSQREFSSMYSIPLSTLRKWEQGESSPAPYVLTLLARTLPDTTSSLKKIKAKDGRVFYCDFNQKMVSDVYGNKIVILATEKMSIIIKGEIIPEEVEHSYDRLIFEIIKKVRTYGEDMEIGR